jgi:hypothetical protein
MAPAITILMIIIMIRITRRIGVLPSRLDSAFGIPSGIMVFSDPTTGDIHPTIGDTHRIIGGIHLIIGEEATIPITDAGATLLTAPPTGLISGKTN